MDIHTEPVTSALPLEKVGYNHAEDSGYHTFTPSSFESSEISCDILHRSGNLVTTITGQIQIVTPEIIQLHRIYNGSISNTAPNSPLNTPPIRRALKRPYCSIENSDGNTSIPTPTSYIAGKIQSLHVDEQKENDKPFVDSIKNVQLDAFDQITQYPTTPVKRNCKVPCKRSAKKLDFTTHSLLCETNGLQFNNKSNKKSLVKLRKTSKARTNLFKSDPEVDIISRLHQQFGNGPPVMKILSYISNEDILNFNLVSKSWNDIWDLVSEDNILKQRYKDYLRRSKENLENKDKGATPKKNKIEIFKILKDIHNEINNENNTVVTSQRPSPPGTPRTNRFRKFTKSASLDSRLQVPCVRCRQPGKVTEETSGEVWVACTNTSCAYQYCKFCISERHPGKFCFQYDLNGPSPSKRKKNHHGICTKKSRKNLHRLL